MNHERAILSDFEDRGRGRRAKVCGEREQRGGRSRSLRSDQLPWTWPREAHASSPPGLQDKASAVLKPWYLVLCSGSRMGADMVRGQQVQTQ